MGRVGPLVAAGGGLGPDMGVALTLTLTRRREAAVWGPASWIREPSAPPFPPEATGCRGHGRQRLGGRAGDRSDCPVASGGASAGRLPGGGEPLPALLRWALRSGARCAAGADPSPRIPSKRRASTLGASHCPPFYQRRLHGRERRVAGHGTLAVNLVR